MDFEKIIREAFKSGMQMDDIMKNISTAANKIEKEEKEKEQKKEKLLTLRNNVLNAYTEYMETAVTSDVKELARLREEFSKELKTKVDMYEKGMSGSFFSWQM